MPRISAAIFAVVLSLSNVSATCADPGPVVQWLMNEPASLFDIGIWKLDLELERISEIELEWAMSAYADYDWARNRITIKARVSKFQSRGEDPIKQLKRGCRSWMEHLRSNGGVLIYSSGYIPDSKSSKYSDYFAHFGYNNENQPKDYRQKLDEIIELRVKAIFALKDITDSLVGTQVNCGGPLVSNKIYFEE